MKKEILNNEMERLCYLGMIKEGLLKYSSPVILISRRFTKYRTAVTDLRYLDVSIVKNIVYPLLKDIFSMLGSTRCEVLSVLGFKRCNVFIKVT